MSNLIIKIGDDALDLKSDEVVAITKQAAKVGDFSKVLADGTNEIEIPLTARNKSILDNSDILQTDSEKPYRRLDATLIQEGYETLQDAYGIIESFSDRFRLQLIGGNASFFYLIKDLNLRDLNLSEYDHFWTNQNVFDNRNNTEGFIYALFEQSDQSTSPTLSTYGTNLYAVQTELLLPCFYEKTLIEKIFAAQGYTFVLDITSTNIYDKAVVFAASTPDRGSDATYLNVSETNNSQYSLIGSQLITFFDGLIVGQGSNFWQSSPQGIYALPDNVTVDISFNIIFTNNDTIPLNCLLEIIHSTPDGSTTIPHLFTLPAGTSTQTFTTSFDAVQNTSGGVGYEIYLTGSANIDVEAGGLISSEFELLSNLPITTTAPFNYLRGITCVPDMTQSDFLKDIARKYQLLYDVDEVTHTVYGRRFDKIKENIPVAIDFSNKLHNSQIETKYRIDGYAQTNYLKWKPDDITEWTADGIINVDDQTIEAEKVIVEMSQFAASSAVSRFDTKQVPYVPLFNEDQFPENGMKDRMLLVRSESFGYNINFNRSGVDLPTTDVTFAYFSEGGNEDSLDFPTLIDRFYVTVKEMLYRAKTIDCKVFLRIKDVVNYNPFIPVYIQKFNAYFYWEKLENYVKDKLTKIRLIRL